MKKVFIKNLFESIYLLIDICILSIVIILKLPNIKNISKEKIKVVTGASSSHFKSLLQFLDSTLNRNNIEVSIFTLDLTTSEFNKLEEFVKNKPNYELIQFNFSNYPDFFDIHENNGAYGWKAAMIHEAFVKHDGLILWLDSGNLIKSNLFIIKLFITTFNFYSPLSSNRIIDWTHPDTLAYYSYLSKHFKKRNKNGAIFGLNTKNKKAQEFINELLKSSLSEKVISPKGSSRLNHRYDQSLISLLFFKYFNIYIPKTYKAFGISIHNDID